MKRTVCCIMGCLLAVFMCRTALGRVYVDAGAVGSETGDSWEHARRSIALALADVKPGEEIWVAGGTYREGGELRVKIPNVRIYGGFRGDEADLAHRGVSRNESVVDGGGKHRCFNITATKVLLDGLTIARGHSVHGGGIANSGVDLTIRDCTIRDCRVAGHGCGGAGINSSRPMRVLDSLIVNNANISSHNRNGVGSGIQFKAAGTLLVSNTVFRANLSGQWNSGASWHGSGGAILMHRGVLDARHCVFDRNKTDDRRGRNGGAIFGGTLRIKHCTFYGNSTPAAGGAIYTGGHVDIKNSIFWKNSGRKGAQDVVAGSADIANSCFSGLGTDHLQIRNVKTRKDIFSADPLFVDPSAGNFHLRSTEGRWDEARDGWLIDGPSSPCIDRGAPGSAFDREPTPNGGRANLGAYGNTRFASLSPPGESPLVENRTPSRFEGTTAVLGVELVAGEWAIGSVCWGTSDGGTTAKNWQHVDLIPDSLQEGTIASVVRRFLQPGVTHYYRSYATNGAGDCWAPASESFRTGDLLHGSRDPRVIHVNAGNLSERQDGSCWSYAYRDLVGAWARLNEKTNTLWIAGGDYPCAKPLVIKHAGVQLYGGFNGDERTLEQRDLAHNVTTLKGNNRLRLLQVSATNVTVDGLTFTSGAAVGKGTGGGAIWALAAGLTIRNCTFAANHTDYWHVRGGALLLEASAVVSNCVFDGNWASKATWDGDGGAIYFKKDGARLEVRNSVFHANECGSRDLRRPKKGGAIYADGGKTGSVVVDHCTFYANVAGSDGGAIAVWSGNLSVSNSIFWKNEHARVIAGFGRDIWAGADATLNIGQCNIDTNGIAGRGARAVGLAMICMDPIFASVDPPVDLHLRSQFGRWTPDGFVNDVLTSPCIGLGAYGSTDQASK